MFIIEIHILQCLFVNGSNQKQRKVGLFQISQKDFFTSYENQVFLEVILQCGKKGTYLDTQLEGERTELFLKITRMFFICTSRIMMMNTS